MTPTVTLQTAPSVTVSPVSGNPLQFDVTFVGASGDSVQPTLEVVNGVNLSGTPLAASDMASANVTPIKGPSPVFLVNNPDPTSAYSLIPQTYSRSNASVAMDSSGDFVITWDQAVPNSQNQGSVTDIEARRFHPVSFTSPANAQTGVQYVSGVQVPGIEAMANQFQVNTFTANSQSEPSIGMDAQGNFVIAYTGVGADLSAFNGIVAQKFNRDGDRVGNELEVNSTNFSSTDINYLPYVAMAQDGTFLITWTDTTDPGFVEGTPFVANVQAVVYSSTENVLVPQEGLGNGGAAPTASFDANDDYTVTYNVIADTDNNGTNSAGVYATEYQLFATGSTTTVANTLIRPEFRVNSANVNGGTTGNAYWPGDQYDGRAASDANGDLTIVYSGFGADVSDFTAASGQMMTLIAQEMTATNNSDLLQYLPGIAPTMYPLIPLSSNGNIDGEINEILIAMTDYGATASQIGRMRAILYNTMGLMDGEATGVLASTFDANPVTQGGTTTLQNGDILNATRSGNDEVNIIDINQTVAGGTFIIQLVNNELGLYQNITVPIATIGAVPNTVLDPVNTTKNILNALDSSKLVGINWPLPLNEGPVQVRYLGTGLAADEVAARLGTAWDVVAPFAPLGTVGDYFFEVTFQGEVHDTSVTIADAGGDTLVTASSNEQQTLYIPTASNGKFYLSIGGNLTTLMSSPGLTAAGLAGAIQSVTGAGTVACAYLGISNQAVNGVPTACYGYTINYVGTDAGKIEVVPGFVEAPVNPVSGLPQWNGVDGFVVENHQGGSTAAPAPMYAEEFAGGSGAASPYSGTLEVTPSIAMQPNGSYVAVWTQANEYTDGSISNTNLEFRQFNEAVNTVGPQVSGYLSLDGQYIEPNAQLLQPLQYIVVNFDEQMSASTVTNLSNWTLEQADGSPFSGGISQVYYGMNELQALEQSGQAAFSSASAIGTNQWQAVIVLNGNGNSGGTAPLGAGQWTLVASNGLHDYAGEPLGRNAWSTNGGPQSISLNIALPSGGETMINGDPSDVVNGGSGSSTTLAASSGNTVASDGNGDFVTVFGLDATAGSQTPGLYAKLYQESYSLSATGTRVANSPSSEQVINPATSLPWANNEILVTSNTTATQTSVGESADGDFVVTWSQNDGAAGGGWNVWARAYNATGAPRGPAFMVNSTTTDVQNSPAVALDAGGDFVVTWQSNNQDGSGYGIYARRYDSQGNALGGTNELQTLTFTGQPVGSFQLQWQASVTSPVQITPVIKYNGSTSTGATAVQAALAGFTDAFGNPLTVQVQATSLTQITIEFLGKQGSLFEPLLNVVNQSLGASPAGASITSAIAVAGARVSCGSTTPRPTTRSSPPWPWTPAASS